MDRATKKFNIAAVMSITVGVMILVIGTAAGVLSIVSGATVLSGKKEMEF